MLRVLRLGHVQRWPEDWMRDVQGIFSQVLNLMGSKWQGKGRGTLLLCDKRLTLLGLLEPLALL